MTTARPRTAARAALALALAAAGFGGFGPRAFAATAAPATTAAPAPTATPAKTAAPAAACDCGGEFTAAQALAASKAVFVGTVLSVTKPNFVNRQTAPRVAHFRVDTWWKGGATTDVAIATGDGVKDCGFHFAEEERYLVYAQDGAANGQALVTSVCSRTDTVRHLGADVAALGQGTPAPPPPPGPPIVTPEELAPAAATLELQTATLRAQSVVLLRLVISSLARSLPVENTPLTFAIVFVALALPVAVVVLVGRRVVRAGRREAQAKHEALQRERLELAEKINRIENKRLAARHKKRGPQ